MLGTEEAAHLEPLPASGQQTTERKEKARVEPPHDTPEGLRGEEEIEARHDATGFHHGESSWSVAAGIVDVAQQIGEHERIEGSVGEREPLCLSHDHLDTLAQPEAGDVGPALQQHGLREVDGNDVGRSPSRKFDRDAGRPRGDVENPARG